MRPKIPYLSKKVDCLPKFLVFSKIFNSLAIVPNGVEHIIE